VPQSEALPSKHQMHSVKVYLLDLQTVGRVGEFGLREVPAWTAPIFGFRRWASKRANSAHLRTNCCSGG
jgi:hypothetical protein